MRLIASVLLGLYLALGATCVMLIVKGIQTIARISG